MKFDVNMVRPGEEITVDEIISRQGGDPTLQANRQPVIKAMQDAMTKGLGKFTAGRKGGKSRFLREGSASPNPAPALPKVATPVPFPKLAPKEVETPKIASYDPDDPPTVEVEGEVEGETDDAEPERIPEPPKEDWRGKVRSRVQGEVKAKGYIMLLVPIRAKEEVVLGLPKDLTKEEAKKLAEFFATYDRDYSQVHDGSTVSISRIDYRMRELFNVE